MKILKNKNKTQKGITLIALIITIIVLLILAVVTIAAISGDSIINHAENARDAYQTAQQTENEVLQYYADYLETQVANAQGQNQTTTINFNPGDTIPEGGTYTTAANVVLNAGDQFPAEPTIGDKFIYGDYEYRFGEVYAENWTSIEQIPANSLEQVGIEDTETWGVRVIDSTKSSYDRAVDSIAGVAVKHMLYT